MEHSEDGYSTSTYDYPRGHPVCKTRLQRDAFQVLLKHFNQRDEWPSHGRLKKLCGGLILASPVNLWWWMAEIFIVVTVLFFIYQLFFFTWLAIVPAIVIAVFEWLAFYKTCMRDPGVQVRPPFLESFKNAIKASKKWTQNAAPTTIVEHPNGISEAYHYCWKCHHFRTSDTTHCGTCDCCMIQHDHHCPVFGGCVAKNNLSSFHAMVITMGGFWLYVLVFCIYEVTTSSAKQGKRSQPPTPQEQRLDAALSMLYLVLGEITAVVLLPHLITAIAHACRRKKSKTSQSSMLPESEQIKEMMKFVQNNLSPEEEQTLISLLPADDTITESPVVATFPRDQNHNNQFYSPLSTASHV